MIEGRKKKKAVRLVVKFTLKKLVSQAFGYSGQPQDNFLLLAPLAGPLRNYRPNLKGRNGLEQPNMVMTGHFPLEKCILMRYNLDDLD